MLPLSLVFSIKIDIFGTFKRQAFMSHRQTRVHKIFVYLRRTNKKKKNTKGRTQSMTNVAKIQEV